MKTCSICSEPSVRSRRDRTGDVHRACSKHEVYLDGWVRDANHESRCEDMAARDFEDRSYGRD